MIYFEAVVVASRKMQKLKNKSETPKEKVILLHTYRCLARTLTLFPRLSINIPFCRCLLFNKKKKTRKT